MRGSAAKLALHSPVVVTKALQQSGAMQQRQKFKVGAVRLNLSRVTVVNIEFSSRCKFRETWASPRARTPKLLLLYIYYYGPTGPESAYCRTSGIICERTLSQKSATSFLTFVKWVCCCQGTRPFFYPRINVSPIHAAHLELGTTNKRCF